MTSSLPKKKSNTQTVSRQKKRSHRSAASSASDASLASLAAKEKILLLRKKQASEFAEDKGAVTGRKLHGKRPYSRYRAGSIEQRLDMCEEGPFRGDELLHNHGRESGNPDRAIEEADQMMTNYQMDMSETHREGDDESGDEHSSGLQGGELS